MGVMRNTEEQDFLCIDSKMERSELHRSDCNPDLFGRILKCD
jgi:hypothetical protein